MISQNIYSLHTRGGGILCTLTPLQATPSSFSSLPLQCWRYSRWPCHSGPCVPAGIQLQPLKRSKVTKDAYPSIFIPRVELFTSTIKRLTTMNDP
ncbi:hypothetical protein QQF64_012378 [Cirrhinus molitorella]|uniref:Uncharacterized protein n=1 Tax=Cirrhinus molitorella TaxID=172907 RepID=A0ABR3LZG7_9TELE